LGASGYLPVAATNVRELDRWFSGWGEECRLNEVIFIISQVAIPTIQRDSKGGEDDGCEGEG